MVDTDETVNGYSKFTEQTSFFYSRFLASTTRAYDSTTSIALQATGVQDAICRKEIN